MLVVLVAALWVSLASASANAQPPAVVSSQELVRRAAAGKPIDLVDTTIEGDIDLHAVGMLTKPLRCQRCRLTGSLNATDVVFERVVDLRDSTLQGTLNLNGSIFKERAGFDQMRIEGPASAVATRFLGDTSFRRVEFHDSVQFDQSQISKRVFFGKSTFSKEASFQGTTFDSGANFVQCSFSGNSPDNSPDNNFEDAVFKDTVNFFLAEFRDAVTFEGAELDGGGSFRLVEFYANAAFDRVSSGKTLDFNGAILKADLSLTNFTSSGSVSLVGISPGQGELFMEQLSINDFSMDVEMVKTIRGSKEKVLEVIEHSAQERGDLSTANNARYELLSLQGKKKTSKIARFLDATFYGAIAGYLVRPIHPLVSLTFLLVIASIIRAIPGLWTLLTSGRSEKSHSNHSSSRGIVAWTRRRILGAEKTVAVFLCAVTASLGVAFRRKPDIKLADRDEVETYLGAAFRWIEFIAYKLLLAVLLLAVGNSSATIRQIIDTVRS
jgi:hypothetical protein